MAMDPKSLPPGSIPLRDLSTVLPMAMDPESPPPGNIVFFSISEDNDLVHSYNGGSQDIQALALDWLPKAKCHHVWHSNTEANKTVGFLMRDGCTFFAIGDGDGAGASGSEMLAFLERLREAYRNAPSSKEGRMVGEEINWVVQATSSGDHNSRNRSSDEAAAHRPKDSTDYRALKVTALQPSASSVISLSRSANLSSQSSWSSSATSGGVAR